MKTALIVTAILTLASTFVAVSATVKTLINEHNRVKTEQRQIDEQVKRVRQPDPPKVVTASNTNIHASGLQLG